MGRVTFEILRPVPIAPLRVEARVVRPGRRVELSRRPSPTRTGSVCAPPRGACARGRIELPAGLASAEGPAIARRRRRRPGPAPPAPATRPALLRHRPGVGYHTAMEYRFVAGAFLEPGPATVWMRMRQPLVAGEDPTPLQRVLVAADSGNGVSATLDWCRHLFINVDLTVHLHRMPAGEWVCLDAITIPEPTGIGIADTALYDERGPIGRAAQTLLVGER